ncbi:hypothetical protein BDW68DRAFT_182475 [Aspergillus falconensis]
MTFPYKLASPSQGKSQSSFPSTVFIEDVTNNTKGLQAEKILLQVHALSTSDQDYLIASGQLNSTYVFSACAGYPRGWPHMAKMPGFVYYLAAAACVVCERGDVACRGVAGCIWGCYIATLELGDTVLVQYLSGNENGDSHAALLVARYVGATVDVVLNYDNSSSSSLDVSLGAPRSLRCLDHYLRWDRAISASSADASIDVHHYNHCGPRPDPSPATSPRYAEAYLYPYILKLRIFMVPPSRTAHRHTGCVCTRFLKFRQPSSPRREHTAVDPRLWIFLLSRLYL